MQSATLESPVAPIRIMPMQRNPAGTTVSPLKTSCSSCHLGAFCLPCGMKDKDMDRLDRLAFARRTVRAGQALFREGDRFQYIHAVRSGNFKSSLLLPDGREQVSGFHMAGELMGLDGVADDKHASSAVALEDAVVCAIPYAHLSELGAGDAGLQHLVNRMMSREIVREHGLMLLLGSMNAEERLAAFLLNLSQRLKLRGYSASEFHLRMTRDEIGSYLGLKLETVSRTFSAFQRQGLLEVDKRHIRITDIDGLRRAFGTHVH